MHITAMDHEHDSLPSIAAAAGLLQDVLRPLDEGIEVPGDVIGVYRLIEKLGEGGFGVVWRAEQAEPIKREVALKIIKLGMDTLEVMRRFEQERQALALMDHPNIASVFNAGATPEGRPFFVMELVRGVAITQYGLERALPLAARLSLFREVCSGVQHAHQKGVIHRDLKPSNVIVTEVDGVPVPKIIDFGIAKATKTDLLTPLTMVTQQDQMLGTPLYMSPEQAAASADIDTRSDVYALGVLLYELITGQPPFDVETLLAAGYEEMRRIIREQVPVAPSRRRNAECRMPNAKTGDKASELRHSAFGFRHSKDLDHITLRALEKDRTRRYESASALSQDIQRFLDHEPVHARAPSFAYVAQRWVRRHRAAAAAACVSLLAILGGASVALWQAREARNEAARAGQVSKFLTDMLDHVAEEVAQGRSPTALQDALAKSKAMLPDLRAQPDLHRDLLARLDRLEVAFGSWKDNLETRKERAALLAAKHGAESPEARQAELSYVKMVADHGKRKTAPAMLEAIQARLEKLGERGGPFWFQVQRELIRDWLNLDDPKAAMAASTQCMAEAGKQQLAGKPFMLVQLSHVAALLAVKQKDAAHAVLDDCARRAESLPPHSAAEGPETMEDRIFEVLAGKGDFAPRPEQVIEFEGTPDDDLIGIYDAVTLSEAYILHHEADIQEGLEDLAMARGRRSSRKKP